MGYRVRNNERYKARTLNRLKLIEQIDEFNFRVYPLPKNKTTYDIDIKAEICNCQYNQNGKTGKLCAHIMGVFLYKMNKGC